MKEVTPKKVISRIRNQKKKQIYILWETWWMLQSNLESEEMKEFKLLTTSATITYKGKVCNVLKLNQVYSCLYESEKTDWYISNLRNEESIIKASI